MRQVERPTLPGEETLTPLIQVQLLVPGKMYPEAGIRKIYGRNSVGITNSPLVFPDTSCLGHALVLDYCSSYLGCLK